MNPTRPLTELLEDVEWLRGTDSPSRIAERVGYSPETLARRLLRAGRPDLAREFAREDDRR